MWRFKMEDVVNTAHAKTADGSLPALEKIQEVFARVVRNPFYGKKFRGLALQSWGDFFELPMTTKEELRQCQAEDTLALPLSQVWHYHESFGTTGEPISSWFSREDYEWEADATWRWTKPIQPESLVMNRFPYSLAVPPFILETKCFRDGGVILPVGYAAWNVSYSRVLDIMKRMQVGIIGCIPLEMLILEAVLAKCGYCIERDFAALKYILASGRIVTPALKDHIERTWNVSLLSVYGCTESGGVASTCEQGNLHIHQDSYIIEILDPDTWLPVKKGDTGVLVLTSYSRKASPLFRYVVQDCCRIETTPCACGDSTPVIQHMGRSEDIIDFMGKKLYFFDVEQAVLEFAEQFASAIYFVIVTENKLHIRVESANGLQQPTAASVEKLNHALQVPINIDICKRGTLLDPEFLLRAPDIYKPHTMFDWRNSNHRIATITESIIKWPKVTFSDGLGMLRKKVVGSMFKKRLQ